MVTDLYQYRVFQKMIVLTLHEVVTTHVITFVTVKGNTKNWQLTIDSGKNMAFTPAAQSISEADFMNFVGAGDFSARVIMSLRMRLLMTRELCHVTSQKPQTDS